MYDVVIVAVDHGIPQGNVNYFSLYKLHDLCTIQFSRFKVSLFVT